MAALEDALGQYLLYQDILEATQAEPSLYLAIPIEAETGIFSEPIGELVMRKHKLALRVCTEIR